MADQHSDEHVRTDNVAGQSSESTGVKNDHIDGGSTATNDSVRSSGSESTGVANQHADEGVSMANVELESLKSKGVADKHSDDNKTVPEAVLVEDKHSDKDERIAEVALESLKSKGDTDKQLDADETKAEVAVVADKHTDKDDRVAEVALESLKSKDIADKHDGGDIDEVADENMKSKSVTDKHSDESGSIIEVAPETFKSKGVADKCLDESEDITEVADENMKSKSVKDKQSDEGGSLAEVSSETLKSKGVADKFTDEDAIRTSNATVNKSDSMSSGSKVEINIKTLDSQLHNFIVDKNIPVALFKESIASEVGLPVDQQRLIFRGKVLKDEDLLSEYHVESGHTLHLVSRQPSSGSPNVETNASNPGQNDNVAGTRPHVGHVSHSVVLGTFGVGDQDQGNSSDVNQIIGAVLNFIGTGGQGPIGGTGSTQPHMQVSIPMQVANGNETGNQSQPRSPSQSMPPIPPGLVPAVPTLATPIPESLHTLTEFMNHMDHALSHNDSTKSFPSVELPSNARGLPSPAGLAVVMRHAQRLLSGPAVDSLSHAAKRLEEEEGCSDVTVRTQIQTEAMQSGLAMQHFGALLLELGRTMLTLRIGQSPAESSVNAGPAVYISPSGPNPIMVQPFPLQTNSIFGGTALNHGSFGPVGIGALPRHVNIHIHSGPRATNVESNQGEHANINAGVSSQTRVAGDNMRSENHSSVGQADAGLSEDAGCTGNATSSSTKMKSLNEVEGGSSSSRRNIPLGLGPGGLQPKRRQRQTRSEASSSGVSSSSSGGQLDPAVMNQVMQNPALNNLLAGASNQNGAGSSDVFNNLMTQLTHNPEMMNTVNHLGQQMDGNQDFNSMGGGGGTGGGGRRLDMSSLVQQMMPFVSQALNGGSSSSSSKKLQSVVRKGMLHKRSGSVKSLNTHEKSTDFQMNLENTAQKIMEHYPPLEIFSSLVQTAASLRNNVYDAYAINELSMEEDLAQEFNEMLKRDISRRLQ